MTDSTIKITAEPQKEPEVCKFILEKPITDQGSFRFENKNETLGSGLAEALMNLDDVASVTVAANIITVTQKGISDWRELGKKVGTALREVFSSGKPLISDELIKKLPPEDEIKKRALQIISEQLNPAVASHGGYIELLDVKHNDVFIRMSGGCQGCAMSAATLKQGIEVAFRKEIPLIGSVYDVTDHASGLNPYYSGAS